MVGVEANRDGSTAGAAYIASKHTVQGLARNLAYTYRANNVRVNVVNPGSHITGITANALEKWPDRELIHPDGMKMSSLFDFPQMADYRSIKEDLAKDFEAIEG